MGIAAAYTAYRADDAAEVVRQIREGGIRGASITIPFKETVMTLLDEVDTDAGVIGAVNTIVNRSGRLTGYNTDASGLIRDLEEWIAIRGTTFVVLGAGGAARAAVFALRAAGGTPIIVNRTAERSRTLAERFGCRWEPAREIGGLAGGLPDQHDAAGDVSGNGADAHRRKISRAFPAGDGHDLQPHEDAAPPGGRRGGVRGPLRRRDVRPPGGRADPPLDGDGAAAGGDATSGPGKIGET